MNYKLRSGIVFTKICGQYLLIPDRKAAEICPTIKRLNIISAAFIENIQKDYPMENIYEVYEILSRKSREESIKKINQLAAELCEQGFILPTTANTNEPD